MKRFEFLEHTADVKFRAFGTDFEEAYAAAALALFSVVADPARVRAAETEKITVHAEDMEALLYEYLDALVCLLDTRFFLLHSVDEISIRKPDGGYVLNCRASGDTRPERYAIYGGVKAVTYQQMRIKETNKGVILEVVLDT